MKNFQKKRAGRFGNYDYLLALRSSEIAKAVDWLSMYSEWAIEERERNQVIRKYRSKKKW